MSAVLQNRGNQPYKHGFVTDIGLDVGDERAERRHRPVDFDQEKRAPVAARVPPQGLSAMAELAKDHHDLRGYRNLHQMQVHRLRRRLPGGLLSRRPEFPRH